MTFPPLYVALLWWPHDADTASMVMLCSRTLYDNESNICKEITPAVSHSLGKCTSTVVINLKNKEQGLYAQEALKAMDVRVTEWYWGCFHFHSLCWLCAAVPLCDDTMLYVS